MRRGIALSVLLHILVVILTDLSFSDFFPVKEQVQTINVSLVMAEAPKKPQPKEKTPPKRTQQSVAPKEPPKEKVKPTPPKPVQEKKVVAQKVVKEKPQPQVEPPKEEKPKTEPKEEPDDRLRPEKLDKSKKKDEIKTKEPDAQLAETPDDFMEALDFIENLEKEQKTAQAIGKPQEDAVVSAEEEAEILLIKRHIERNWYRPSGIKDMDKLMVRYEIQVNRDGTLNSLRMTKSSGRDFFDKSIERAIRKAVPLPIPGDKYDKFKNIEIVFEG